MKVRELIETLAKKNWDSEVRIDVRLEVAPNEFCKPAGTIEIKSISSYTSKGIEYTTLNERSI